MIRNLTTSLLGIIVAVAGLVLSSGCEGPQGPPGEDAGVSFDGFAEGIQCADCHTSDVDTVHFLAARRYQWEHSLHATGGTIERNSANCSGCHTTEGFIQRERDGWVTQVAGDQLNPSPVGCFACHSPHLRADFTLRRAEAVSIESFVAGVPAGVFDYGSGNLCVQCHQTRTSSAMSPIPDPARTASSDTISITSSRWYPHYGVQGQMLMGTGGF
ncbi:MAG: multiheme c-type cytochrome, partial [Ignavibacteria bacterium]|nr:multiheme c-type cytochrome [Ignavibacteria bacterium]